MNENPSKPSSFLSPRALVLSVYALYGLGFFTGITAAVGVIIAHIQKDGTWPWDSHFQYQIRTFWIGLGFVVAGYALTLILIGWVLLAWWVVWTLVRTVKGTLRALDGKPIENPQSWLW
jgi:uncharacterized membrane protein